VADRGWVASGWVRVKGFVVEMEPVGELLSFKDKKWVVMVNGIKSRDVYWDERPQGDEEDGEFWRERYCLLRIGCIPAFGEKEPYDEWSLLLVWSQPSLRNGRVLTCAQRRAGEGVFERCGLVRRSKPLSNYGPDKIEEYSEHTRETSPWFGRLKEAVDITIV
jgi:hypothetical protein